MKRDKLLDWIENISGKRPRDEELYVRAITHGSYGGDDYQRLEFLGDRILGLVISSQLYHEFPTEPEGRLSQRLNGLVSGTVCGEVAESLGTADHILLGKQAQDDGARNSNKVLGDIMESLIGAIYLDHGMETVGKFILKYWKDRISQMERDVRHPKSALQEWAAANNRKIPVYELVEKIGPHHDLRFTVTARVDKVGEVQATASSIQSAETAAAELFLEQYT